MKMGDRRLKKLDRIGTRVQHKTALTGAPVNRAERRKFAHVLKAERVDPGDIDDAALFEALAAVSRT